MRKIYIDKELLYKLYVIEQKTVEEISKKLNINHQVISRNLKENNIEIRGCEKEKIDKELLIELYVNQKLSIRAIAKLLNVVETRIRYSLYAHTIERRNKSWKSSTTKNGKEVPCEICGKLVYRKKHRLEKFDVFFCSWECAKEYQSITRSISELPEAWRRRKYYRSWRKKVLERDNFKCKICGNTENLVAHHIIEAQDCPELRLEIDNGIALCQCCHIKIHKNNSRNYIESLQEAILVENPNIGETLEIDNTEGQSDLARNDYQGYLSEIMV